MIDYLLNITSQQDSNKAKTLKQQTLTSPRPLGERGEFQNEARVLEIQGEGEKLMLIVHYTLTLFSDFRRLLLKSKIDLTSPKP